MYLCLVQLGHVKVAEVIVSTGWDRICKVKDGCIGRSRLVHVAIC
jgi:hypothetical protein